MNKINLDLNNQNEVDDMMYILNVYLLSYPNSLTKDSPYLLAERFISLILKVPTDE